MKLSITGSREMLTKLREVSQLLEEGLENGMDSSATAVLDSSTEKVPVDKGVLRDSKVLASVGKNNDGFVVEFGYGAEYATIVHEDGEGTFSGRGPKYLERAMSEVSQTTLSDIGGKMKL